MRRERKEDEDEEGVLHWGLSALHFLSSSEKQGHSVHVHIVTYKNRA